MSEGNDSDVFHCKQDIYFKSELDAPSVRRRRVKRRFFREESKATRTRLKRLLVYLLKGVALKLPEIFRFLIDHVTKKNKLRTR